MKKIIIFSFIFISILFIFVNNALAGPALNIGSGYISGNIALGDQDPRTMVAQIINVLIGFLGVISIIIVLLGGFKWMASGGNEDKITEAKKLMANGLIGLIIILSSWGITKFVLEQLINATQ